MVYQTDITSWTENVEKILVQQSNKCASYKWMHDHDADNLVNRNKIMNIVSILFVSISATSSLVSNNVSIDNNKAWLEVLNVIYPILLYITTVISSLQHFFNYEREAEKHRTASIRYNALYNNVIRMIALDKTQRQNVNDYFSWATKEYDNIFGSSPDISDLAVTNFKKNFESEVPEHAPTILEVKTLNQIENNRKVVPESEKLKYELERFVISSYNC